MLHAGILKRPLQLNSAGGPPVAPLAAPPLAAPPRRQTHMACSIVYLNVVGGSERAGICARVQSPRCALRDCRQINNSIGDKRSAACRKKNTARWGQTHPGTEAHYVCCMHVLVQHPTSGHAWRHHTSHRNTSPRASKDTNTL